MGDNEIIKALEWHSNDEKHCSPCPYEEHSVTHYCLDMLLNDALDLINRQKEKIELLNLENLQMIASIKHLKAEAIKEFAERVKKELTGWETEPTDEEIEWTIDNLVKEMVGESNE